MSTLPELEVALERSLNSGMLGVRPSVLGEPLSLEAVPFVDTPEPGEERGFFFARFTASVNIPEPASYNGDWAWINDSQPMRFKFTRTETGRYTSPGTSHRQRRHL